MEAFYTPILSALLARLGCDQYLGSGKCFLLELLFFKEPKMRRFNDW